MMRTCCFTGHRELPGQDTDAYRALTAALEAAVSDALREGCRRFIVGGAKGFDLLAGEWILALKKVDPSVSLSVYIPYRGQPNAFSQHDAKRYAALLDGADDTLLIGEAYRPGCMRERNARMVQDADLCIAYVRKRPSGSEQTMRMAQKKGIPVFLL